MQEQDSLLVPSASVFASARIGSLTESFHYISNFLSPSEATTLLTRIPSNRWVSLSNRRLQVHPSQLSASNVLLDAPLPAWLVDAPAPIVHRFGELGVFAGSKHGGPNHCLVNEYRPGEGIMPHEDGAAYHAAVATVSLGSGIVLDVYDKQSSDGSGRRGPGSPLEPVARIYQEPGSLLVTADAAYTDLLHGISPVEEDIGLGPDSVANWSLLRQETRESITEANGTVKRGTRTSLTYRDVLKVKKIGIGVVGRKAM